MRVIGSTREFDCECSRVRLRVLARSFVSTREHSRVLTLASFDSRVAKASLSCARSHSSLTLACDIASETSRSHSFVKLRLSGTVSSVAGGTKAEMGIE